MEKSKAVDHQVSTGKGKDWRRFDLFLMQVPKFENL